MAAGGCFASHLSTRDAGWNLHRGEVFSYFSDCGSVSSPCRPGSESRTGSKPDHDGGKGWIEIWIRTQVNLDPHTGFFYCLLRGQIRTIKCYRMALFGLLCCKLKKNYLIDPFLRFRPEPHPLPKERLHGSTCVVIL
jgi:hypothetical protein